MAIRELARASLLSLAAVGTLANPARGADSDLRISSIGYVPDAAKRAAVLGVVEGSFVVRRAADDSEAFAGTISPYGVDGILDFTALTEEGSFVIEVAEVGRSPVFPIATSAYLEPFQTVMLGFYGWRSGVDVTLTHGGQTWSHPAGHLEDAYLDFVGQPGVLADGTGGWYDAGDYGKYTVNSAITMGLLLQAWEDFRDHLESIPLQIPESGGDLPDYLAELRFQLDWMLKMQFEDGSVSHKITPVDFPAFILPAADTAPRYFSPWGSAATAGFVATMAKAARVFADFDGSYAAQLEAAAQRSYAFLAAHPGNHAADMSDFEQAQYQTTDADDRVWAAAEMWETTGDADALSDFESRVQALPELVRVNWDWGDQSNLGVFTYLRSARPERDPSLVSELEAALVNVANIHVSNANTQYGRGIQEVYWGSNGTVARICATLQVAHQLTDDARYRAACVDQIAHLFGRNEYGRSQVTGVGIEPPLFPHDRRSGGDAVTAPYPGYLVGGASRAGNWVDEEESYETNEIAINWQGALVYALAGFVSEPREGTGGAGGEGGSGGSGGNTGETGGSAGQAPGATGGAAAGHEGGASPEDPGAATSSGESGGCSCRAVRTETSPGWLLGAGLLSLLLLRRRRALNPR